MNREVIVNRDMFDAIVEDMISNIKERIVNTVNDRLDFPGLFDDQVYQLNAVDFIDGVQEWDSYLAVPMYTNNNLTGIFLSDYSDDDDGNHEWLPSIEIPFNNDQLERIQVEIKKRRDEIEK